MHKEFFLTEIFGLPIRGTRLTKQQRIPGNIPLVTAGEENEGVAEFISNEEQRNFKNMITIDMFGNCFFRDYLYKADDNILSFGNSKNLKAMLYIVAVIRLVTKKYSYSKQYRLKSYKLTKISLPVIEHSEPNHVYTVDDIDWQYMEDRIKELEEDRIKELEEDRIKELEAYLKATNLDDYELTDEDKKILFLSRKSTLNENDSLETYCEDGTLRFKKFNIGASYTMRGKTIDVDKDGLFNIIPTKKKINAIDIEFNGNHPYVARGEGGNGIRGYIDYDEKYLNEANTISFGQDTATVNYQSQKYFTGDKIQVFKLNEKYGNLTEDKAIYLINSIKKAFERFLWGQQSYALDMISKIKIILPITPDGEPDFDYMERYIRAIEKLTIADVVKYKDKVIDTTKMLVNSQS